MHQSIYTCADGSVNDEGAAIPGNCKLDTKPQPQWVNSWPAVPQRAQIYNDWSKMIEMKINEPVFEGNYAISPDGNNIRQRIYVYNDALPSTQLKNVVILANFSVAAQNVNPSFPYTGTWYNLMDNSSIVVTNTTTPINIPPGQSRIYGNQLPTLAANEFEMLGDVNLYPNPSTSYFTINSTLSKVQVMAMTGQLVKDFTGSFSEGFEYNISDLPQGIYLVKVLDDNRHEKTMRLIKQ
jgi:hypothetical protein